MSECLTSNWKLNSLKILELIIKLSGLWTLRQGEGLASKQCGLLSPLIFSALAD